MWKKKGCYACIQECHRKEVKTLETWLGPGLIYHFNIQGDELWKSDKTKEKGFEILGIVNYGKAYGGN